jgi:hypothetical protein
MDSICRFGVSNFERSEEDLVAAKDPTLRPKTIDAVQVLNRPEYKKLPDDSTLHPKLRMCLLILEARSYANSGDTKMFDERLAKVLQVSTRTVQRYQRRLEKDGFTCRITVRSFDRSRVKVHNREGFYSCRVIRCIRPFVKDSLKAKSSKELGWKTDPRPPIKQNEYPVSSRWMLDAPRSYIDRKTLKTVVVTPMASSTIELSWMNLWSFDIEKLYYKIRSNWLLGDPEAKDILGYYLRES